MTSRKISLYDSKHWEPLLKNRIEEKITKLFACQATTEYFVESTRIWLPLESWKRIANNNWWHNDSARNRSWNIFFRGLNTSRIYFLNSTTRSSSPVFVENVYAHASNFLNLLADNDGIISADLSSSVLSVVKRAFVFVAISMDCTVQAATSTFKS